MKLTPLIRLLFLLLWLCWTLFAGINLVLYNDDNPIKLNYHLPDARYKLFFPQGWAFFTKNPRDDYLVLYHCQNGKLVELDNQRQSAAGNLLGLRRNARSLSVEYSYLLNKLPDSARKWIECKDTLIDSCISKNGLLPEHSIVNNTRHPLITGRIFLVKKKVVPWAWSSNYYRVSLPVKIISLEVKRRGEEKFR